MGDCRLSFVHARLGGECVCVYVCVSCLFCVFSCLLSVCGVSVGRVLIFLLALAYACVLVFVFCMSGVG